jgi:signal transduction histidine kinase/DNA-binding response OmpR family regulator
MARELRPDVVLMDLSMPRMDGIEATCRIRQELPESGVVIVSQHDPAVLSRQAREIGAAGWVAKSSLASDLIPVIQETIAGRNRVRAGEPSSPQRQFFAGGGEMGQRIRSFDWSKTVLGPVDRWPEALKNAVRICIGSRNPIVIWWGRSALIQFYNDAYISFLGRKKHPVFLGGSARECWSEIWETVGPMLEHVFATGDATWSEDFLYVLNRNLPHEEGYFTFSYSPIWDDTGRVEGIFCACYETTARVIGDRRLRTLRDLGRTVSGAETAEAACRSAAKILEGDPADIPFALLYLLEDDGRRARLAATTGITGESKAAPEQIDLIVAAGASAWQLQRVLDRGSSEVVSDLSKRFGRLPGGAWPESPETALVVPIPSAGQSRPTGFLVAGLSPRRIVDADYHSFFDLIAGHISRTISNARAYEEERKRAEALAEIDRAKTVFFSNVSHEFRTPLALILGPLEEALSGRDGLTPNQRERLEVVRRNSFRLLKLVNTLLDFSRIEAGRIQASYVPTDLAAYTADLASVFRSAIERAGLRLIINCQQISEPVYVDTEMWEKITFNLISNALKFTFAGEIEVALREANRAVELVIRDTGTGIPPDDLPHLFERFYRVKGAQGRTVEGSGIGLALVQELAKLHGGSVRVESQLNRGSTFTVTVPLGKNHLPADRIGADHTPSFAGFRGEAYVQEALRWLPGSQTISDEIPLSPSLSAIGSLPRPGGDSQTRSRVLLADDNADMREYVQRLLQGRYEVVAVTDGQSALESAREQPPDLMLADVMMPRLDGFGLLRALRSDEKLNTVPVILVSARAGEESRIVGLHAGADDYLVKPFSARELLARVESQLSLAALRRHAAELERQLREKAELERRAARESEERFRAFVNASSYVVYRMSPDWSEMRQLDGRGFMSDTPMPRKDWLDEYIHPDDQPLLLETIREAVRTKSMFELEHRVRRTDGTLGWTYSRAVPLMNENGEVIEWFGAASDVTARREAEENYRKLAQTLDVEVRVRTRELEERNAEILRQSEQLRDLSARLLHVQDEERRHMARELHDSAGQTLALLGLTLGRLATNGAGRPPEFTRSLEEANELVRQLTKEIRTMSYLLHPPLLEQNGLRAALSWYVSGFAERSGIDTGFEMSEDFGRLPREMELAIFRLVQESLTNIHRHSGSKTALIKVLREPDRVLVEVRDQGKGIPAGKLAEVQTKGSGVGIRGMRERLRQFRGEMIIDSTHLGTTVLVTIPVSKGRCDPEEPSAASAEAKL